MHNIHVEYAVDDLAGPDATLINKWGLAALENYHDDCEVAIRIVSTTEMVQHNQTYRQKNGPTNVLSFPADLPEDLSDEFPMLGDIIICAEVVNHEAVQQKKAQDAHWAHMVVHGIFHLLGHDHVNDQEAEEMEALEIDVLKKLGFNNPYEHGEHINDHEWQERYTRR